MKNYISIFSPMNKINLQSEDVLEDTILKLKQVYPTLFDDEGNLNEDELKNLLKRFPITTSGRYEFNWAGKMNAKRNAYKVSKAALKPEKEKSLDFDTTQNIIIEGDNLEVLKLLQKSYFNKIKCIYIDPPYNTGKDFIYTDNFTESIKAYWELNGAVKDGVKLDTNSESQGRYHSNWLDMMYPRLLLARNLLKEDGVIFVSIDDNEVHNLRKVMDEVFGEENFVATIIWQKKYSPQNDATYFSTMHDYIICFTKLRKQNKTDNLGWSMNLLPRSDEQNDRYLNPDNDPRGDWKSSDMSVKTYSEKYDYEILTPKGRKVRPPKGRCWRFGEKKYQEMLEDKRIWFGTDGNSIPSVKRFLSEVQQGITPSTIWFREDVGDNQESAKEIRELFEYPPFDTPKPTWLIKRILELSTNLDSMDIILDFFAGSGTTAQAGMELNKDDGGNRKYILVQIPESTDESSEAYKAGYKTISDICIERVKRVSEKIKKENEGKLFDENNGLDLGFKVLKLAPSFFPENTFTPDPEKSEEENMQALQEYIKRANEQLQLQFDEEELLYELLLKDGFEINFTRILLPEFDKNKVYRVSDKVKDALVCIDVSLDNATIQGLEKYKNIRFVCLERALDTTKKWNLKKIFDSNLWVA